MSAPLHALSIQQPWCWAILHAGKRVENRGWAPPRALCGQRIALHASKGVDAEGFPALSEIVGGGVPSAELLPKGAIVATARLVGAARITPFDDPDGPRVAVGQLQGHLDEMHTAMVATSLFSCGSWCWVLEDVVALPTPIPCGGKLGLWLVEKTLAGAVRYEERLAAGEPSYPHVELHGQALADLPRALRWMLPDGRLVDVPKSQVLGESTGGALLITRWLASKLQLQSPSPTTEPA